MASTPSTSAPSSTVPASSPKVSSEDIISQKTDLCISNAIVKTGIGFSSGVILSVLLFRRRSWPVWLGTGFGLGSGWTDCERSFNPVAIPGVRVLPSPHHPAAPGTGSPSVFERLSEKTADLVDVGKSKGSELLSKGQSKGEEALGKGKEKAKELEDKRSRQLILPPSPTPANDQVSARFPVRSAQESLPPPQDCAACRIIGFGTLSFLSVYSFKEAYQIGYLSKRTADNRARGALLVLFGVASGLGGVYRLVN